MKIGSSIRKLRLEKGITIQRLSQETGLSVGLISQVERDMVSPSVVSLWKISQALDVPIGYFFEQSPPGNTVIRSHQRRKLILPTSKAIYELLSPGRNCKIEFLRITIEPGEVGDSEQTLTHEGEECGLVLQGKMEVQLGSEKHILEAGDSIYFNSMIPHRFRNIGDETVVAVWVDYPPLF